MKKLILTSLLFAGCATVKPAATRDYADTSVRITNLAKTSGGTGVIYQSGSEASLILTNRHVCGLLANGGYVLTNSGRTLPVAQYKPSKVHDLCLVQVKENLEVNTRVADAAPELYSKAYISGHPRLAPHTLTSGDFSQYMNIEIMTGLRPCTEQDAQANPLFCMFFGGVPIIETYESQYVSATILPGSSGSAVFNEKGEIAGLAFASASRELSYAFIVPQPYVYNFVHAEQYTTKWEFPVAKPAQEDKTKRGTRITALPFNAEEDYVVIDWANLKRFYESLVIQIDKRVQETEDFLNKKIQETDERCKKVTQQPAPSEVTLPQSPVPPISAPQQPQQ